MAVNTEFHCVLRGSARRKGREPERQRCCNWEGWPQAFLRGKGVQGNGNLLIGKAYTCTLNLEPGDEFDIKLGKKAIRLLPTGDAAEHSEAAEGLEEMRTTARKP